MATSQNHSQNTECDVETAFSDENVYKQSHETEESPLLGKGNQPSKPEYLGSRIRAIFQLKRCCLNSRAALLILLWNFLITFSVASFVDPSFYTGALLLLPGNNDNNTKMLLRLDFYEHRLQVSGAAYGINAFFLLFYPIAGYLADVRFGRHKMIMYSLYTNFCSALAITILGGPFWLVFMITEDISSIKLALYNIPPFLGLGILVTIFSLISFNANVIQYGVDQLYDSSSEDLVLFIHWYVWTTYLGILLRTPFMFKLVTLTFIPCILPIFIFILGVSLCIQRWKKHQYLVDSGSRNPYKLVYKVLKFSKDHKNAIHRSAFTYCEDELPSRLDLGKEKYGGPFTTEQVEDVKAFLGILGVLLTLGPILTAEIAVRGFLPNFAFHIDGEIYAGHADHDVSIKTLISNGSLPLLLVVILIPLYLCLLRPFIHNYIPGMLKRMGIGMILLLLSALCTLSMDIYGHLTMYEQNPNSTACVLSDKYSHSFNDSSQFLNISSNYLTIQCIFNATGYILLYTAAYEFICAQSPHSMKGLLIGTFFAIRGVFNLLGIVIVFAPFTGWQPLSDAPISCGIVYYLINVVIAFVGIVTYTCVARKYQYRQRDEPDNIYRYAEEYYANSQDEPNYDYDDYDNLKVETTSQ